MILKQFYLSCLAHASYMVMDTATKTAAVIDPQRDIGQYLEEADKHDVHIKHVILTHFHADFVAGHLELRDVVGARIHLGARAETEYEVTHLKDGDVLEFGSVRLRILETPGHTPEGISVVAYDLEKSDETPEAVFTGDTLFVGDVGRPDLMASIGVTAEELGAQLYDSLHSKLMQLPDSTTVYPAHGAGSMCGKHLGKETFSTIGTQRELNYALQPMSKEEFIQVVTADQPSAPDYFLFDAMLNRRERSTLDENLELVLHPLTLDQVLEQQAAGAQVLDVRGSADFAGAHLADSINIGLDGRFATWAGTLLTTERPILLIAEPGTEKEAAMRLGRIGFDDIAGYAPFDMRSLEGHPKLERSTKRITAQALHDQLKTSEAPYVLDVRTQSEWESGHIEGSQNLPLGELHGRLSEIPRKVPAAVVCRTGYRSSAAVSLLESLGFTSLTDVIGGLDSWSASGLPTVALAASSCPTAKGSPS